MNNEKINEIKSLDKYFPKGDKRRGEALVLVAEAYFRCNLKEGDKVIFKALADEFQIRSSYELFHPRYDALCEGGEE